jgi:tRNA A-37 threonylcarbamoyl transferase component Bud32
MPFVDGENVGPYRIVAQLGQGGMATVYKAYHPALDRYVAIKVLHPAFMEDSGFLARFQREAKVVAKLDHPNIVPIFDFAEHDGRPYLVMKFIEGETLKARMMRGPLEREEGLRIIERVGDGLAYAHRQGILHRDIKPSNVLLSPEGAVFLADFGLARIAQAGESTLSSDQMLGTPQYISPEQARGEKNLDAGTDIYSFGVVLYELVVGRVPFSADTPFSIIHDHIYKPLPMPRAINPTVPEPVQTVLLKALAKGRKDRYAKVEDLVSAFSEAVNQAPGAPMPDLAGAGAATRRGPPPRAEPARKPPVPLPQEPAATLKEPIQTEPQAAKGRPWLWAVAGIAITCICLSAFLLLTRQERLARSASVPLATESARLQPVVPVDDRPSLAEAQSEVSARPDDPLAHMKLAEALLAERETRRAVDEFLKAARLAQGDAGDYGLVSEATFRALEAIGGPGKADPGLLDPIAEFVFASADSPKMLGIAERLSVTYPDWDVAQAAAARTFLFTDNSQEALTRVNLIMLMRPEDPFARAVEVEFNVMQGNKSRAVAEANEILAQDAVPGWLQVHLKGLISKAGGP